MTLCASQSVDDWMYLKLVPQELLGLHHVFSHQLQILPLVVDTLRHLGQLVVQPYDDFVHVLTERQNSETSAQDSGKCNDIFLLTQSSCIFSVIIFCLASSSFLVSSLWRYNRTLSTFL